MALVNQDLVLDVVPGPIPPILHLTEYDENMEVVVTLQRRGQPFQIPTGTTAKVEGTIAGHPFSVDATPSGNTMTFSITESMTAFAGRAWTKIKLTQNNKPVSTCGFWLDCDRAGVEADTILHSPGFQEQINEGIAEYFDNDPPFFELPSGGQSGQALVSDGQGGAYWGTVQGGGGGLTQAQINALDNLFRIAVFVSDPSSAYAAFQAAFAGGGEPDPTPQADVYQNGSSLYIVNGVTAGLSGSNLTIS